MRAMKIAGKSGALALGLGMALSWDLADWNWKQNQDTGQFYKQLFAADLSQAKRL